MWILAKIYNELYLDISENDEENDAIYQGEEDIVIFDPGVGVFITNSIEMLEDRILSEATSESTGVYGNSKYKNQDKAIEPNIESNNENPAIQKSWVEINKYKTIALTFLFS